MSGQLIGLDNQSRVRPVKVREIWRRCMAKCVLGFSGTEANNSCGTYHMCKEMEEGMEGGIYENVLLCQQNSQEEDWGFLLIYTQNTFIEENWTAILWEVRYEYTSDVQFNLNCYWKWDTPVIQEKGGTGNLLHINEGVTQVLPV